MALGPTVKVGKAARPLLLSRSKILDSGAASVLCSQPPAPQSSSQPGTNLGVTTNSVAARRASKDVTATVSATGAALADRKKIASLSSRLAQVERLNQEQAVKLAWQAQEIASQSKEIQGLLAELEACRSCAARGRDDVEEGDNEEDLGQQAASRYRLSSAAKHVKALRTERDYFQQQCEEMRQFLRDYGMEWVGDVSGGESDEEDAAPAMTADDQQVDGTNVPDETADTDAGAAASSPSSPSSGHLPPPASPGGLRQRPQQVVDLEVLAARVAELNATVESSGAQVVTSSVGGAVRARLVAADRSPLPLTLFRDGLKLGHMAFQAHGDREAQQVLQDILDGYFPYILKERYPDGVEMRVVDRREQDFDAWLRGQGTGGRPDPELLDGGDRLAPAGARPLATPSRARLLAPGTASGARGASAPAPAAGGRLAGGAAAAAATEEVSLLDSNRDPAAVVARLLVKLQGGRRVAFCMEPGHTVGALEDALERWAEGEAGAGGAAAAGEGEGGPAASGGSGCCVRGLLRTAFPPRAYTDRAQTLEAAGLTPSATLFVGGGAAARAVSGG